MGGTYKWVKKGVSVFFAASMVMGCLAGCGSGGSGGSDGGAKSGKLIFLIWDSGQKAGMEAIADAYTEKNPDVSIEVQATGWDEYWTKLEGAATSNTLPDIFWMHSNQMFKYADNGILADCSEIINESDYSEIAVANAKGSDGKVYGVPKDKDTIAFLYNKRNDFK